MGRGWMRETLLITTRRSAPATSIPWLKPARMAASRPKRKRATTKEPKVSAVRTFLRLRLARNRGRNLVIHRPHHSSTPPPIFPHVGGRERCYRDRLRSLPARPSRDGAGSGPAPPPGGRG